MIIEHSALLHSAEMVLKSAGISLDQEMPAPRGTIRDKPVGLDLLYSLHTAARKSLVMLQHIEGLTDEEPPKRKPGRPSKKVNKGDG